jgi:hypothetical protein
LLCTIERSERGLEEPMTALGLQQAGKRGANSKPCSVAETGASMFLRFRQSPGAKWGFRLDVFAIRHRQEGGRQIGEGGPGSLFSRTNGEVLRLLRGPEHNGARVNLMEAPRP